MSVPYVMLADIPEADRNAFLNSLAKRQVAAEGLPARLPEWAPIKRVPRWASEGQCQPPAPYEKYASPTSMQFEPISDAYWLAGC
jgi:hypothetical protein